MREGLEQPAVVPDDRALIAAARREAEEEALRHSGSGVGSDAGSWASMPPPDSFPGYELTREVHRGGQGVVYQAVQKATKRKVAIKVLREGPFAGDRDRARFEREVQILARLNHPGIVAIHDSGSAAGRAFFVMDYVSGQPLDVHVASVDRGVRGVLVLFAKVCHAVNAAHLRGVIHRDLKPSNILVDSTGEPHILDFGLAKTGLWGADPVVTQTGQFVGSLPWASPEQAEGDPDRIDVRTDVYSLGVILYHMLTGRFPYPVTGALRDVLDNIGRTEPARPRTHDPAVDDEVEAVVLKCLSKDRERRYQTAGEVARDVERYLAGEPIEAKRDSTWYVLSKALRHYRRHAAVGVAFVVLVLGALVVSVTLWQRAEVAGARAEAEAGRAGRVRDLLFAMMDARNPWKAADPGVRADILSTAERIAEEYRDEPRVRADCLDEIATLYAGLGRSGEAVRCLEEALEIRRVEFGERHPEVAWTLMALATYRAGGTDDLRLAMGNCDEAQRILESRPDTRPESLVEAGHLRAQILHRMEDHEGAWNAVVDNGAPLLPLLTEGLELTPGLAEMMTETRRLLAARDRQGVRRHFLDYRLRLTGELETLWRSGREEQARQIVRDHCAPFERSAYWKSKVPGGLCDAAVFLGKLGTSPDAREPIFRESIAMYSRKFGARHPEVAHVRVQLGLTLTDERPVAAEVELREALEICRETLAPTDRVLHECLSALGGLLVKGGRFAEAEGLLVEASRIGATSTDLGDVERRRGLSHTVELYEKMGRREEAEKYKTLLTAERGS